jgi:hypothetical protein
MQRRDLLETPERLAGSGGVARVAPPAAGEAETSLGLLDWSRASVDSASVPAKKRARKPVQIP